MPTYDYRCTKCEHTFELFHAMSDQRIRRCPQCKGRANRVPGGGAGLLFRGSGFYITDYRSKNYKDGAKQDRPAGDAGGKAAGKSEAGKKEPKSGGGKPKP